MNDILIEIEKKSYDETSSPEVIEAIKNRVSFIEPRVILLWEIPVVSKFSLDLVFARMTELASTCNKECAYLIDISGTDVPNAATRRHINDLFKTTLSNVKHVSFVTGKNFIINTAARFVMYQTNLESFSIVKTREDGLREIRNVLN